MASLGVYLDSISLPLVQKVLVGLGIGTVTYVGLQAAFNQIQTLIISNYNSVAAQIGALFFLAGFDYSVGLVLAAYAMRVSMVAVKKLQVI